ncbi:GTP-binding protein Era [Parvularcula bermudensis HTCC2503]|uniref:GTPase Era n=1 Tax=Parvularcula bermudensis (strain ATCC BAA-594 / HTCC2503 / KCTC 12087) TaxID=314260 RepID=E0TBD8_PARBH|nr:GTPase Era [Parvularcula bermudensis]ADM09735.1 GTP-binding protein Era [Parvularcula bermudensis HTCC2503]
MTEQLVPTRAGIVTVLGAPNAGKSTFVNQMVGAKVSIVTHKVQTTRTRIRGIAMAERTQMVFVDTPGIFVPRRTLDRAMVAAAWEGTDGADVTLLLVDAPAYLAMVNEDTADPASRRSAEDTDGIVARLKEAGQKAVLVLNKIDRMPRPPLLLLAETLNQEGVFTDTFMISAKKDLGTEGLRQFLIERMPEGPYLYPEDQLSDITDRLMAAEITREKLFLRLHQELPYSLTVETEEWGRTGKGELRIGQTIYVERDGQKALVLGQKGKTIAAVGKAAREDLAEMLGETVHLFLFVKVRENWTDDPARFREIGLEKPGRQTPRNG